MQAKLLSLHARAPERAHSTDAGFDLFADLPFQNTVVLRPGERLVIPTGVAIAIPEGYYGRIADRSGNAFRAGIHVLAGVVDYGYSGQLKVILLNTSKDQVFEINQHDRIAQLVVTKIYTGELTLVDELVVTERGTAGFGSTGR